MWPNALPDSGWASYNSGLLAAGSQSAAPRKESVVIPWLSTILNWLVLISSFLLIFLVLIQRGKGGGLAGAFGGVGGSSAFGSRAGDLFTRITIILAAVWILLIMVHVKVIQANKPTTENTSLVAPGQ
jgi:preprotein translocase subunit SecG